MSKSESVSGKPRGSRGFKFKSTAAAVAVAASVLLSVAPAHAASHDFGSKECSWPGRAAIYMDAQGWIALYQSWSGSSHSNSWWNANAGTARTLVVPVGVAKMTSGTGTYGSNLQQAGKDCRLL